MTRSTAVRDILNGNTNVYYEVVGKPSTIKGWVQSCTSDKCCTVYFNRKWTSKKTGESQTKQYVSYIKDRSIKYKVLERSKLKDYCPDCGSTLFTERGLK